MSVENTAVFTTAATVPSPESGKSIPHFVMLLMLISLFTFLLSYIS